MPTISTFVECPVARSFRVEQVAGMFDLPLSEKLCETFTAELPGLDEDWTIGAIVGPSGSGKTTLARHAYGDSVWRPGEWPEDRAVIDGFGEQPIKEITQTLTAVGLSSPPSWVKPYAVLSNGEKFRCDLARALLGGCQQSAISIRREPSNDETWAPGSCRQPTADSSVPCGGQRTAISNRQERSCDESWEPGSRRQPTADSRPLTADSRPPLVVFDEFTSVVDRTAARIGSAAVAKAIRSGRIPRRFVAVTCHYDVLEWLEVDWFLDLAAGRLQRRRLRRPELRLSVVRADASLWPLFARHHYLSGSLPAASVCYAALVGDPPSGGLRGAPGDQDSGTLGFQEEDTLKRGLQPVAFCSVSNLFGARGRRRISRLVVLPDFQGVGIGSKLLDAVAAHHTSLGQTIRITTSHPAMLAYLQRSPRWRAAHVYPNTRRRKRTIAGKRVKDASGRCVATFEWVSGE